MRDLWPTSGRSGDIGGANRTWREEFHPFPGRVNAPAGIAGLTPALRPYRCYPFAALWW
jgi:hypothetical protein